MRLAHLILAHNNPLQLERLVKRLSHKEADVYIHLDAKTDIALFASIGDLPNTHFTKKRIKVMWGEYSTLECALIGMAEILETGIDYTHINLLSGNDYQLQPTETIHKYLFQNAGKTFMWFDQIFDDWYHGQARINNYDLAEFGFPGRFLVANLMSKVLPKRKLPYKLTAYGRAQWLTITPECIEFTLRYMKDHPALRRFFKMTWCVDEVYFQTVLCNSPMRDKIVNNNLRYLELQHDFRPRILTMADAKTLATSGKFYARKFDLAKDSAIFDYLDNNRSTDR